VSGGLAAGEIKRSGGPFEVANARADLQRQDARHLNKFRITKRRAVRARLLYFQEPTSGFAACVIHVFRVSPFGSCPLYRGLTLKNGKHDQEIKKPATIAGNIFTKENAALHYGRHLQ